MATTLEQIMALQPRIKQGNTADDRTWTLDGIAGATVYPIPMKDGTTAYVPESIYRDIQTNPGAYPFINIAPQNIMAANGTDPWLTALGYMPMQSMPIPMEGGPLGGGDWFGDMLPYLGSAAVLGAGASNFLGGGAAAGGGVGSDAALGLEGLLGGGGGGAVDAGLSAMGATGGGLGSTISNLPTNIFGSGGGSSGGVLGAEEFSTAGALGTAGGTTAGAGAGFIPAGTAAGGATGLSGMLSGMPGGASAAGALLGGAAGLLGGSSQAGTSTSVTDIPEWLKPYATNLLNSAQTQFQNSQTPNALNPLAQAEMAKTIQGNYLNPESNPYLRATYDQGAKALTDNYLSTVQPRTDALFAKAGAFGPANSAYQETVARNQFGLGQNLSNLATDIYGNNYNTERSRQFGATTAAPDFSTSMTNSGFAPFNQYASLLKGWGSQTSQPYYENKLGSAFGGAMTGYSLGNLFK